MAPSHANPAYAFGRLQRALDAAASHPDPDVRARSEARAARWRGMLEQIATGRLQIGRRTPVANAPPWITLEVAHGGFATGELVAGGPLQAHERQALTSLGLGEDDGRLALNRWFLSDDGQRVLLDQLRTGRYRVEVAEEGALLVVAWLAEHDQAAAAMELLEALVPFFDRLRYYPVPAAGARRLGPTVHRRTVGEVRATLEGLRPPIQVQSMNRTLTVWHPWLDRLAALFLDTVEGEAPRQITTEQGTLVRRRDGQPAVTGGWPCRVFPEGWEARARGLHAELRQALAALPPTRRTTKGNLGQLALGLERVLDGSLDARTVGRIRAVLAATTTRHGALGSPERAALRMAQAEHGSRPTHRQRAEPLIEELGAQPQDGGLSPLPTDLPRFLERRIAACLDAPLQELIDRGVVPSGEVLADLLPQITGQVAASGLDDPDLRALYTWIHSAFRRRRSLLLLDLAHQVQLHELPWAAALIALRRPDHDDRDLARATLEEAVRMVLQAFPERILPNRLIQELRDLCRAAELELPLTEELAVDIFMGRFSVKFLAAAQAAARLLQGTLYARYYDLPCKRVLAMPRSGRTAWGVSVSPAFAKLCRARARAPRGTRHTVANGLMIEQQQILTTHNLAVLVEGLDLRPALAEVAAERAQQVARFVVDRHAQPLADPHATLLLVKNTAYAWRQLVFVLSFAPPEEVAGVLDHADALLAAAPPRARRLAPVFAGLRHIAGGGSFDAAGVGGGGRRFLGWTAGPHWLLDPTSTLG